MANKERRGHAKKNAKKDTQNRTEEERPGKNHPGRNKKGRLRGADAEDKYEAMRDEISDIEWKCDVQLLNNQLAESKKAPTHRLTS